MLCLCATLFIDALVGSKRWNASLLSRVPDLNSICVSMFSKCQYVHMAHVAHSREAACVCTSSMTRVWCVCIPGDDPLLMYGEERRG